MRMHMHYKEIKFYSNYTKWSMTNVFIFLLVFVNANHLINIKKAERLNSNTGMTMIYLDLS